MKKTILIIFISLMSLSLFGCTPMSKDAPDNMATPPMENTSENTMNKETGSAMDKEMMKSFSLMDLNGETVTLESLKGKPVYIKFWASWCSICLAGLEEIDMLSSEMNDFHVLTIVSPDHNGEQSQEKFKAWFEGLDHEHMRVLLDNDGSVSKSFEIRGYPTSVFIDAEGKLIKVQPGHMDNDSIKKMFEEKSM